ncbi:MAG: ABC transporter substrate-binding protein [bacterium]|nr:ABC transporter substrate-binding protein [bacterium]
MVFIPLSFYILHVPYTIVHRFSRTACGILITFLFAQLGFSVILPQYGGTLRIPIPVLPTTYDPAIAITPAERTVILNLYDRLVEFDSENKPIPSLAESWSTSPDGLTWTFHLRTTAKFHTGRMVTADDVKYSIERLVSPSLRSPKSWLFSSLSGYREYNTGQNNQITGIESVNQTTVRFRLLRPYPKLLYALAHPAASIVCPEKIADIDIQPIGSGPFIFLEQTLHAVRLLANPVYWEGRPYLDGINFILSEMPTADLLEFELGNLDFVYVPEEEFHRVTENPALKPYLVQTNIPNLAYLGFNLTKFPMSDIKFRQAVAFTLNRQGILEFVLNNHGILSSSAIHRLTSEEQAYFYSLTTAQELFRQFAKRKLSLLVNRSDWEAKYIAQRIQVGFIEAGYPIQIEELPTVDFIQRIKTGNFDMFYSQYFAESWDPEIILRSLYLQKNCGVEGNQTYFYHPQLEPILDSTRMSQTESERDKFLQQALNLVQQELPVIPLFETRPYYIRQPYLQQVTQRGIQSQSLKNIWINHLMR